MAWFRGLCRLDVHHSIRSVCLGDAQISHMFAGHVPLQKRLEHRPQTAPCVSGWHHARSGSVKISQAPVNLLQDTLHGQIRVRTDCLLSHFSFLTGNKPPGLVPNKFMYMTKDLNRLAEYFNVPLQSPADPFEAMFEKGTSRISSIMSID